MKIFIVGQITCYEPGKMGWELAGVYSDQAKAEAACKDDRYFVGPVELDVALPEETTVWPGAYYPRSPKIELRAPIA